MSSAVAAPEKRQSQDVPIGHIDVTPPSPKDMEADAKLRPLQLLIVKGLDPSCLLRREPSEGTGSRGQATVQEGMTNTAGRLFYGYLSQ